MKVVAMVLLALSLLTLSGVSLLRPTPVEAQASSNGVFVLLQVGAPSGCVWPAGATVTNGMALCATTSGLYYSLNGSATFTPVAGAVTLTGTAPIVVSGTTVSCPTCVTGTVVNSFQGRTGNVTLTKADVTGTGLAVTTTSNSTLQ